MPDWPFFVFFAVVALVVLVGVYFYRARNNDLPPGVRQLLDERRYEEALYRVDQKIASTGETDRLDMSYRALALHGLNRHKEAMLGGQIGPTVVRADIDLQCLADRADFQQAIQQGEQHFRG